MQYSSLKNPDSRADLDEGQALVAAAQREVAHLSFDPSGIAAVAAGGGGLRLADLYNWADAGPDWDLETKEIFLC